MTKFKKLLAPVVIACLVIAALIGGSYAPQSLGEIFDPSGNPFANRFSDVKDIRAATSVVAASDSRNKFEADFYCDGTSDEDEINAALAVADRVVLLDGTYTIDDPITIPGNNRVLEGQGRATFIDGDGLATTEHGIVAAGRHYTTIRNLSIQTQDGGGKTCHAIYVSGDPDYLTIEYVVVVDSDSDGIRLSSLGDYASIRNNWILDCDDYGLYVTAAKYAKIANNWVEGAANNYSFYASAVDYSTFCNNVAISGEFSGFWFVGCDSCVIEGNSVFWGGWPNGLHGFYLDACDYCTISGNEVNDIVGHGIAITNTSIGNVVTGNVIYSCDSGSTDTYDGISVAAGVTHTLIIGNQITASGGGGINVAGENTQVIGNHLDTTRDEGISVTADFCLIADNVIGDASGAANTWNGIYLNGADYCVVQGNKIVSVPGNTKNGIELADSDYNKIAGNYCDGVASYGLALDANCDKNKVDDNDLGNNNTLGALNDLGVLTFVGEDNQGITIVQIKIYRYVKNTSGVQRDPGDVVILKAVAAGNEVNTTNALGDDNVYGMVAETIADNAWGLVLVKGKTTVLQASNDNGAIAIGDPLCASATPEEANLATAGTMAFARALETCDAAGPVSLDAFIKSPWD